MVRRTRPGSALTSRILDALFDEPPVNEAELERRLGSVDVRTAQRLLTDRLRKSRVSVQDGALYVAAFLTIGVGDQSLELLMMAADRARAPHERAFAVAVLSCYDPETLQELALTLSPGDAEAVAEASVIDLLVGIEAEPERSEAIAGALSSLTGGTQVALFEQVEAARVHLGSTAATVYAAALAMPDLASLRRRMLDAVVAEDGMEGIALLERLRDEATSPSARRDMQAALLRARTMSIDPSHTARSPDGYAWVGSCDGQGAYLIIGIFENPDSSLTLADLCIRASADIRDGFVVRRQTAEDLDAILDELRMGSGSDFTRVSLPVAAELVAEAVERTREQHLDIPRDAVGAVAMFARARTPHGALDAVSRTQQAPDLELLRALLCNPEYATTWFFDDGDLAGVGADPPARRRASKRWIAATAALLDTEPIRRRVVAMARHMARWHGWREEPLESALCAAAACEAETTFRRSALVTALLERSAPKVTGKLHGLVLALADPSARQHLKVLFFRDVQTPRGHHLAQLDMTEAAFLSLDKAFDALPGERRPREDARNAAAHGIGSLFADFVIRSADGPQPVEPLTAEMAEVLTTQCRLLPDETDQILPFVVASLGTFVSTVCPTCPVSCLTRPHADVADTFFAPVHPMAHQAVRMVTPAPGRPRRSRQLR
ncbi:MAG: hypothetical protein AMXMBFR64_49170 [Myxococcales bacterium]